MSAAGLERLVDASRRGARELAVLPTSVKNRALRSMARALRAGRGRVIAANAKDVRAARAAGLAPSLIGRLSLDARKIEGIARSLESIARLTDPVGRELLSIRRPNGLRIRKVRVPIGVILIIYESRPNVTADCMALCLKSGNAVVLKGGSEALATNAALFDLLDRAGRLAGVPAGSFALVRSRERADVRNLLEMEGRIDLVIPRGGEGLIREVARTSRIPVIKHYKGVCHVYLDRAADPRKARDIVLNAKVQNPGVCNAMETLLVHRSRAKDLLPLVCADLKARGVEIRGCPRTRRHVAGLERATDRDWHAEYLDLVLAVKVVDGLDQAIDHVETYGSHHSDAIVTEDTRAARSFTDRVDSACVFVNASTRFNDGGEFGMGAEMGISTDKLHARGPMALEELTSYKYVVTGRGHVRA